MDFKPFLVIGILVNSALYVSGVFIAGLVTHSPMAWKLALIAFGLSYISYFLQITESAGRKAVEWSVALSILAGTVGGLRLLF